jgi:hypothetical protein
MAETGLFMAEGSGLSNTGTKLDGMPETSFDVPKLPKWDGMPETSLDYTKLPKWDGTPKIPVSLDLKGIKLPKKPKVYFGLTKTYNLDGKPETSLPETTSIPLPTWPKLAVIFGTLIGFIMISIIIIITTILNKPLHRTAVCNIFIL